MGALIAVNVNDVLPAWVCPSKPDRVFTQFNGFDASTSALDVVIIVNASATYDIH